MYYNLLYQCVFCLAFINFLIYWIDLFFFSFSNKGKKNLINFFFNKGGPPKIPFFSTLSHQQKSSSHYEQWEKFNSFPFSKQILFFFGGIEFFSGFSFFNLKKPNGRDNKNASWLYPTKIEQKQHFKEVRNFNTTNQNFLSETNENTLNNFLPSRVCLETNQFPNQKIEMEKNGKKKKKLFLKQGFAYFEIAKFISGLILWCSLTLLIIFRYIKSNHFPLSNFYEALIFLTWGLVTLNFIILFEPFKLFSSIFSKIVPTFWSSFWSVPFFDKGTFQKPLVGEKTEDNKLSQPFVFKKVPSKGEYFGEKYLRQKQKIKSSLVQWNISKFNITEANKENQNSYQSLIFPFWGNRNFRQTVKNHLNNLQNNNISRDFLQKNFELQPIASLKIFFGMFFVPKNQTNEKHAIKNVAWGQTKFYKIFTFLLGFLKKKAGKKIITVPFQYRWSFGPQKVNANQIKNRSVLETVYLHLQANVNRRAENLKRGSQAYFFYSPPVFPRMYSLFLMKEPKVELKKKHPYEKQVLKKVYTSQEKKIYGGILAPCILFIIAFAQFNLSSEFTPLVPALKSNWLLMHVSIMICSYTTFIGGGLISLILLIQTFFFSRFNFISSFLGRVAFLIGNVSFREVSSRFVSFLMGHENQKKYYEKQYDKNKKRHSDVFSPKLNSSSNLKNNLKIFQNRENIVFSNSFFFQFIVSPTVFCLKTKSEGRPQLKKKNLTKEIQPVISFETKPESFIDFQKTGQVFEYKTNQFNDTTRIKQWNKIQNTEYSTIQASQQMQNNYFYITLDNLNYRMFGIGFPLFTLGLLSGAVWANSAWGSYWSWDIKEVGSFIHWLVVALYFHCRYKNYITISHLIAFLSLIVLFFNFFGVSLGIYGSSLHAYS